MIFFDLKLNFMILLINDNLVEKQGVSHFKSKKSPSGQSIFPQSLRYKPLAGSEDSGSLLQQRGLFLFFLKMMR